MSRKSLLLLSLIACMVLACCHPACAVTDTAPAFSSTKAVIYTTFYNLSYFQEYLTKNEVPAGFIMPEDILSIGTFNMWIDLTDRFDPPNTDYYYVIDLHNEDAQLWLRVEHYEPQNRNHAVKESIANVASDMTTLNEHATDKYCQIQRGNLTYYYWAGKKTLGAIAWQNEYATFTIGPEFKYENGFTYTPGSFMEKLLSLDEEKFQEAQAVLLSLGASGSGDPEDSPSTSDPIPLFTVLLPASATGICILSKKKKRP